MVCETTHAYFHKYKVHVRADTWDGGKCLCGLVVNRGFSCFQAWVRGGRSGGFRNPLVPGLPQELRVNWSCSMGFLTQAPRPALWKALMSACLAEWYSVAACLASWYELGLSILIHKMDESWKWERKRQKVTRLRDEPVKRDQKKRNKKPPTLLVNRAGHQTALWYGSKSTLECRRTQRL